MTKKTLKMLPLKILVFLYLELLSKILIKVVILNSNK